MNIIDRFEGDIAIVETDSGHINISRSDIDGEPREGDVIIPKNDGLYAVDKAAAKKRRALINQKLRENRK
jgi:hypothetical protein